ncbi:hypothetical protein L1049_018201 [Liquidambar formosana]|uniref:Guanylate kinase 1 n=1 Tax=Liquidambar formosana TaxID=63359 RepID=A0AAP0R9Q3_LIQFO
MAEDKDIFVNDEQHKVLARGIDLDLSSCQTSTILGDKTYVVGGSDDKSSLSIQIFDNSNEKWIIPTVLGTKPSQCQAQSAVLVNKDRIFILLKDFKPDDCIWFLEVDTQYVREQKKILETEVVAWSKGAKGDRPMPVVISGPSGVGKGTLISELMKEFPSTFGFSVSHTTRAPRDNEKEGVHYHFTERQAMGKAIQEGKFLEYASVHGNLYGTSLEAVEVVADAGKRCILDIDVQGAKSIRAKSLEAIFIFICPPSFPELERRLRARGTETEEQVQKRLQNATKELEQGRSSGVFDHILTNEVLEDCYKSLKKHLGLDGGMDVACHTSPKIARLPLDKLISETSDKFLIHRGGSERGKASENSFVLDLSSLKGGAPGRTRGFNIYTVKNSL